MPRPPDPEKDDLVEKFKLTQEQRHKLLHGLLLEQLRQCQSDEARRILLGISMRDGRNRENHHRKH
jgi:hypothetical protein